MEHFFGDRTEDIMANAIPDLPRLKSLWRYGKLFRGLKGAYAELGVYRGGTALLMYEAGEHNRAIHLFDTFVGMPYDDTYDEGHKKGDFNDTSLEHVRALFKDANNVLIHKGEFPLTVKHLKGMEYLLVHIDADLFSSTYAGIKYFWPRLVRGGCLVFDDYGWPQCPGVKEAIDLFVKRNMLSSSDVLFAEEAPYQITMVKKP